MLALSQMVRLVMAILLTLRFSLFKTRELSKFFQTCLAALRILILSSISFLKVIQAGDKLIITKLDRIARSVIDGTQLIESLNAKGVIIGVLNMGIIDNSPTGRLIRNIMLSFSEFERDMIIQRTQEGKAVACQNPNFRDGCPKKFPDYKSTML